VTVLIFIGGFLIFLIYKALKAQRRKPYLPLDYREVGRAVDDIRRGEEGYVLVAGEYWRAFAVADIKKGEKIRVVEKKDGFLVVEPILEKPA
ncbi:MAG TPA: nodulation protein NfeD, partial [Aigarchaeota archaeon]|nr:nodulation protein NfeD [Aigarchaeota archaeon]